MAKFTAHGSELARVQREFTFEGTVLRTTKVLMSDHTILEKHESFQANGKPDHAGGWKEHGELVVGLTTEEWVHRCQASGWTIPRKEVARAAANNW